METNDRVIKRRAVLGCTLLATYVEAERSFFVFRLIKRHLSSRMVDTKVSALTLMKIHYSKHIGSKQIADRLIKEYPRRLSKASLFD